MALHWRLNKGAIAYATTSLGSSMMHAVFMFNYVNVFMNYYHVPKVWFNIAQTIFMLWNALNDPLFGYMQDNCDWKIMKSRRHTVLYGAPLFALSFLVPWFRWTSENNSWITGLHLTVSLCFYDAMFTYVLLATCCIFAEAPKNPEERIQYNQYAQLLGIVGSTSVFVCSYLSNNLENFQTFQVICIIIAILAWLTMTYTGLYSKTKYDLDHPDQQRTSSTTANKSTEDSIWRLTWQIITHLDFFAFVSVNFLTEFHRTSITNFTGILTKHLLPTQEIPAFTRSLVHGAITFVPQILIVIGRPVLTNIGYYKVYKCIFILKIIGGSLMVFLGRQYHTILLTFFVTDAILSMIPGSLMGLPLSDVVDSDMSRRKRKHPLSSMVFGTNALITKPAQSLAPMLVVNTWNQYGYDKLKASPQVSTAEAENLHNVMFLIICVTPIVIGILQSLVWQKYQLRNTHITETKYVEV